MPDRTYKMVELVGVSEESVQQAVRNAVARAGATLKGLGWFEVTNIRGTIKDDQVTSFQVTVKLGFRVLSATEVKNAKKTGRTKSAGPAVWDDDHW